MVYTKNPQTKIKKLLRYLSRDWRMHTVEQVQQMTEQKFNVGIFVNYGRTSLHTHEFEIYRKFNQEWVALLCRVELPFNKFKKPLDY